jgi:signal peptidase I
MFNRAQSSPDPPSTVQRLLKEYLVPLIWAVVLASVLRAGVAQSYHIPSGSMEPTLLVGDRVLVSKLSYAARLPFTSRVILPLGQPQRGDMVVFAPPSGQGDDLIKRVVGLPGEVVELKAKQVYINGLPLADAWGRYTSRPGPADDFGPAQVPQGHYFMLGDNRDHSYDSRLWNQGRGGFVPMKDIRGKALLVLWSWEDGAFQPRWTRLVQPLS